MSSADRKRLDPPARGVPTPLKKAKSTPKQPAKQSCMTSFFGKKPDPIDPPGRKNVIESQELTSPSVSDSKDPPLGKSQPRKLFGAKPSLQSEIQKSTHAKSESESLSPPNNDEPTTTDNFKPIVPKKVIHARNAHWKVMNSCLLVRKVAKQEPRHKVAAFDLDGTILQWTVAGWPSQFEHYELWNTQVFQKMKEFYNQGYKIVIISNQGGIRKAFDGKRATLGKNLIEWLASKIDPIPLNCVMSTDKKCGYHKPNTGMWKICEQECNKGVELLIEDSFYVGDSVGEDDPQGGVDENFAKNVGEMKGGDLKFYEPQDFFGQSNSDRRKSVAILKNYERPPESALRARAALLGGYLKGPIMLVLCGAQGSGKSTFASHLTKGSEGNWVAFSQDTINKGKPGKREEVENEASRALNRGQSVIVDRTHLTKEQREHFVSLAQDLGIPVHCVLLNPPKEVIATRVRERQNHPAKVEGDKGARLALGFLLKLQMPQYSEAFTLISISNNDAGAERLYSSYRNVAAAAKINTHLPKAIALENGVLLPSRILGTMKMGKRTASSIVRSALNLGFHGVDTAPTYNNESEVGDPLDEDAFCIVKIPMRAVQPEQVREEFLKSLKNLGRGRCSLLLLHWPATLIEAGKLEAVWKEMEKCHEENLCLALGVCNFNVNALRQLLPICKIRPSVNQVERHPLLPQWELLDFCWNNGVVVQAHTPLGQGAPDLFENDSILRVSKECSMSAAQTILHWNLLHHVPVVPKCCSDEHLKEALTSETKMTPQGMKLLDEIKRKHRFVAPPFMLKPGVPYGFTVYKATK